MSDHFFSSAGCAIDAQRRPDIAFLRKMQRIACWENNKQACHQSWEESLVQRYCQEEASISYIINIT